MMTQTFPKISHFKFSVLPRRGEEGEKMNIKKIEEAIDFLSDIVNEADDIICLLQEIEVKLAKLDKKSRQLKEDGQNTLNLIEWELNKNDLKK